MGLSIEVGRGGHAGIELGWFDRRWSPGRLAWRGPGRAAGIVAALAATLIVPWVGMNAGLAMQARLTRLDPDAAFVYIVVHHAVMAGLSIAIMLAVLRPLSRWGLRVGDWRSAVRWLTIFAPAAAVLAFAFDALPYLLSGTRPALSYAPTPVNVVAAMAFTWLFVGVGEELLFRGVALGLLARSVPGRLQVGPLRVSVAGLLSALIFAAAHAIYYDRAFFLPFAFSPDWAQLGWAFLLGTWCAALRERTGSLLGPILCHNLSNGLVLTMSYLALALAH